MEPRAKETYARRGGEQGGLANVVAAALDIFDDVDLTLQACSCCTVHIVAPVSAFYVTVSVCYFRFC